jgi:hypothetical protein
MSSYRKACYGIATLSACLLTGGALAADFDQTFLDDYSKLQPRTSGEISDLFYAARDLYDKAATITVVAVDQPHILISPDSPYKGGKPADMAQLAELMRATLAEQLTLGGYGIADAPGPDVLYLRLALTDLELKKKKRPLLGYTPIGAVVKAGTDAMKETLDKVDITRMTLQAELLDGSTGEVLAAIVMARDTPEGDKEVRIELEELTALLTEYGARMRCGLDNARLAPEQRIDCLDPAARAARAGGATQ